MGKKVEAENVLSSSSIIYGKVMVVNSQENHINKGYVWSALILIGLITLFRLWFCTRIELVGDEAYYWLWSNHLDWSYYSKGPGVAWAIALGTAIFGDNELGVRVVSVLFSAGTGLLMFDLGRRLFDEKTGFWTVLIAMMVPLFVVGSFIMTIDPLSVFFWTLGAWLFWKSRDDENVLALFWVGLSVGIGMLCKFTNIVLLICIALFCLSNPRYRKTLWSVRFWVMVAVALLCLFPVFYWNSRYDWITFDHLIHRGSLDTKWVFSISEVSTFIISQFFVFNPFFMLALLIGIFTLREDEKSDARYQFLLCLFLPLVLFYIALSVKHAGQPNWAAPSYVAGVLLLVVLWRERWKRWKFLKPISIAVMAFSLFALLVVHILPFVYEPGMLPFIKGNPFNRIRGWKDVSKQVAEAQAKYGANFLIANKYSEASLISFYHPDRPTVYIPNHVGLVNQFSFWPTYSDGYWRESAIFLTEDEDIPEQLVREFEFVKHIGKTYAPDPKRPIRTYNLFLCGHFGGNEEFSHDLLMKMILPSKQPSGKKRK